MNLKEILPNTAEYEAMANLRMTVLLNPIGIPRSYINPQKEASDILIGAFENEALIGCCVLTRIDEDTVQLRQMAVDTSKQQKGVGAAIVSFAEGVAKANGYKTLLLHARETVTGFYQKCGYAVSGGRFEEVGIGHYKMSKQL